MHESDTPLRGVAVSILATALVLTILALSASFVGLALAGVVGVRTGTVRVNSLAILLPPLAVLVAIELVTLRKPLSVPARFEAVRRPIRQVVELSYLGVGPLEHLGPSPLRYENLADVS